MNLETLVERACLEAGYNDADDVTAAEKFARHWDEHIWNSALWKAALVACDVAVTPASNDDHAEGIVYLPEVIDRVVAVRSTSNQIVVRGQEHYYRMDWDAFGAAGTPLEFVILPPGWMTFRTPGFIIPTNKLNGEDFSRNQADDGVVVRAIWRDAEGIRRTTETPLFQSDGTEWDVNYAQSGIHVFEIERLYKPVTAGPVTIMDDNAEVLAQLTASQTAAPLNQRIRLIPKPPADLTVTVLGKAKYEPLEFDQQEPALRNCTNALLAFMRGSLKRRGGEIGAAQLEFAEANALVKQVEQIEALQAANNQRFIPEEGYGPTGGLGPMGSYFS